MMDCLNISVNASPPSKFDISDQCALFDFIVYSVVGGLLVCLGIVGNALSFYLLWCDAGKTATVFLLRCMAAADSLVLVAAVPLYVLPYIQPYTGYFHSYYVAYPNLLPFLWASYLIPYTGTILLTVLVSINRYQCVCRVTSRQCSKEHALYGVAAIAIFSIVFQ